MSLTINTNLSALDAAASLSASNAGLQKSLKRLSSGCKITEPSDDAGGLAVAMKMNSAIKRTRAVINNIGNALSFLQTQDGALKTVGSILTRMSELKMMYTSPTQSTTDKETYNIEYKALQDQLNNTATSSTFNGVNLFTGGATATTMNVSVSEDGTQNVTISVGALLENLKISTYDITDSTANDITSTDVTVTSLTTAIANIATMRAQNGAEASKLQFANDMLTVNGTNLEAAVSRIMDTDIALESSALARFQVLVQAGTAMLAQANTAPSMALKLLQ